MTDASPEAAGDGLRAVADTIISTPGAGTYVQTSYDIAPEDHEIAESILRANPRDMPVLSDASGRPVVLKATALPPEQRQKVEDQLRDVPFDQRTAAETRLVGAALADLRIANRQLADGAGPYQAEQRQIALDHDALQREAARIVDDLAAVSHHETSANGDAIPVLAFDGDARRQRLGRLNELNRLMGCLRSADGSPGPEADRRLAKALKDDVAIRRQQHEELADHAAAVRLSEQMVREERIQKKAEQLARFKRNEVR